jgi:hypothetical protein
MEKCKCPLCGKGAEIVWRSSDGKRVGVRCSKTHPITVKDRRGETKGKAIRKNAVFQMNVENVKT